MPPNTSGLIPVRDAESARALGNLRFTKVHPPAFRGAWLTVYEDTRAELFATYAERGPQYRLLCDLAAGAYVQVKRMESSGAIKEMESLEATMARVARGDLSPEEAATRAQAEIAAAESALHLYLKALEQIRRLVDQAQKFTEAKKAEIVVTEVNAAIVNVLLIVEAVLQDPPAFEAVARAVRQRISV